MCYRIYNSYSLTNKTNSNLKIGQFENNNTFTN